MFRTRLALLLGIILFSPPSKALPDPGELIGRYDFDGLAPQDIAWDGEVYYITSFLDERIHRFTADLQTPLEPLLTPFDTIGLTGIAFNQDPEAPRLWVIEPFSRELREITLDGEPTGNVIAPDFLAGANPGYQPTPRGMAFDPGGSGGLGSFYILESPGSRIFEVRASDGEIIQWFSHPDDPDGFPGKGASAPGADVDLIFDANGDLTGFYLSGGRGQQIEWIRRLELDGTYTGFRIPLAEAGGGGKVSGFLVKDFPDPGGGDPIEPALIALVESKAEIAVLDGTEEPISEILDFTCTTQGNSVELTWRSGSVFDRVEIYQDCRLLESFNGNPGQASDRNLGPGVYRYRVKGFLDEHSIESEECTAVIGGGLVLRTGEFPGLVPQDLAVDKNGDIYSTDYFDSAVHVHDGETLEYQYTLDLEFLDEEEDQITGIAYSPEIDGLLYIYNSKKNRIYETDMSGILITEILVKGLPNDPENRLDKAFVISMVFDSQGGPEGFGLFWIIEGSRQMIYSVDREGNILSGFPHPVAREYPLPPLSLMSHYIGGISESPAGFAYLDLTSGSIFERDVKRIIRIDAESGEVVAGVELPLDGLDLVASTRYVAIQHARRGQDPILLALADSGRSSFVAELDPTLADPLPITNLKASLQGREDEVILSFQANAAYEKIQVFRDCQFLAEMTPEEFSLGTVEFTDSEVPPGFHRYDLRAVKASIASAPVTASIRVGVGAILERTFSFPVLSPYQLTRDPVDGSFLVASSNSKRSLFRFHPDLTFDMELEDVIPEPWEVATMAVRPDQKGSGLIYVIAWKEASQIGGSQTFPLFVLERDGTPVRELETHPPRPSNGFVTYPTGLCWNERLNVFFYLERNSSTLVQMDAEGNTLRLTPHPAPPQQSYVFNLGLSVDPENGSIWLASAGPLDLRITRALQVTPGGRLTGLEIPLGEGPLGSITGIAVDGPDLIVTERGAAAEILRIQSFHPIPAPDDLTCRVQNGKVIFSFAPGGAYDQVQILRNGEEITVLPGNATSYQEIPPDRDRYLVYSVRGVVDGNFGNTAFCEIPPLPEGFIRGDVDQNKSPEITDAIRILEYLFLSGPEPICDDAADTDDDGEILISDVIRLLFHLFLGQNPLPLPYPDPGEDPTPDFLTCS